MCSQGQMGRTKSHRSAASGGQQPHHVQYEEIILRPRTLLSGINCSPSLHPKRGS